jgi:hypothetical protein
MTMREEGKQECLLQAGLEKEETPLVLKNL